MFDSTTSILFSIAYEVRWQDLKDLFRKEVGEVAFVELFSDESGKPRGCGIIEFVSTDSVRVALDKMNRYDLSGRNLVIKEDSGNERDKYGFVIKPQGSYRRDRDDDRSYVFLLTSISYLTKKKYILLVIESCSFKMS